MPPNSGCQFKSYFPLSHRFITQRQSR